VWTVEITTSAADLARAFGATNPLPNLRPRYNAAPTQSLPVVLLAPDTKARHLEPLRWGLIPFWAKDAKIGLQHHQRDGGDGRNEAGVPRRLQAPALPCPG
jgi:putative SOS response-associated peptidase YedK